VAFDCIPKTRYGVRAGRSDDAELRLPDLPGVSLYHFSLTFNTDYCPIIRDLGSTCGTKVIYDGMEGDRLSNFDWIVDGSDFLRKVDSIIVKVLSSCSSGSSYRDTTSALSPIGPRWTDSAQARPVPSSFSTLGASV
jgi:pSer/pThr/pTyr-binding forkhead associated (FHA) protein